MPNVFDEIRPSDDSRRDVRTPSRAADEPRTPVEREVSLAGASERTLSPAVHAWLDGEITEAAARAAAPAREIEFWSKVARDAQSRGQMRAPAGLQHRIMAAVAAADTPAR